MSFQPNPKQALCLLGMLFGQTEQEREPMQSKVKPDLPAKEREPLVRAGFLEKERRGRPFHLIATDSAWQWASTHLSAELMLSKQAAPILRNVLTSLGAFLEKNDLALADVVRGEKLDAPLEPAAAAEVPPAEAPTQAEPHAGPASSEVPDPTRFRTRIEGAIRALAGGAARKRVRLSALRQSLGDIPRQELDALLLEMQQSERLVLYRHDNPVELSAADHQAALSIAGNPRHLVYLEA